MNLPLSKPVSQGHVKEILERRNEVGNMDYMVEKFDLTKVLDRDVKVSLHCF